MKNVEQDALINDKALPHIPFPADSPSTAAAQTTALKGEYLAHLETHATGETSLRKVAVKLLEAGVSRAQMVRWAVAAGYDERYIRSLLSRLLSGSGRLRQPGAGRRTPEEALLLLSFAREKFGPRAGKFLLAAYRADRSQALAPSAQPRAA